MLRERKFVIGRFSAADQHVSGGRRFQPLLKRNQEESLKAEEALATLLLRLVSVSNGNLYGTVFRAERITHTVNTEGLMKERHWF